jgi:hypothetical protein
MLRIDTATKLGGLRVNEWMSIVLIGGSVLFLILRGLRRRPGDTDDPYTDGHRFDPDAERSDRKRRGDPEAEAAPAGDGADRAPVGDGADPDDVAVD